MSTQLVLCKARKHLGHIITGKLKRLLWPPDSASSEYGLVRSFDHLSPDVSSQLSKIASAEEMPRAGASQRDPGLKTLGTQGNCFH